MRINLAKLLEKRERTADGVPFSSMDVIAGHVREVRVKDADGSIRTEYRRWKPTKQIQRLIAGDWGKCGAKTRRDAPCAAKALPGRKRCRFHGGLSTGPTTEAGREAIRESNRRRGKASKVAP